MYCQIREKKDITDFVNILVDFFKSPPFRILHLTDLHFDTQLNSNEYQIKTINSLIEYIKVLNKECQFDFAVFTGDIANKNVVEDHKSASKYINIIREELFNERHDRFLISRPLKSILNTDCQ